MKNNVGVNGQSVVTKKSNGTVTTFADTCKTPAPSGPIPIPYPNIAKSSDLVSGSKSVEINGASVCLKGANFNRSTGDEAGTAGGVLSGKTGGIAEPISYSFDVKIEGKNVVRNFDAFLSNNKNTPPAPVMQNPVTPVLLTNNLQENEALFSCDWTVCDKQHTTDINSDYPRNGSVKRGETKSGKDYASAWVEKGLEPWEEIGQQKHSPNATWQDYQEDLQPKGDIKLRNKTLIEHNLALIEKGKYKTEKHHLISVHLFDNLNSLANNCQLVGYNVNDAENGICLPYFVPDIVRHDRQCHRGPHPPIYDRNALKLLKNLQTKAEKYCTDNQQQKVIVKLNDISQRIRQHILAWDKGWELRSKAHAERRWSHIKMSIKTPS